MNITLEQAQRGLRAGLQKAAEMKSASSIAILDSGRNLVAFVRMEDALLASIEISRNKAYTAASMRMKTGDLAAYVQPGAPLFGLEVAHNPAFVVFGGGAPVIKDGKFVGAVGVAGGMVPDDEAVAAAVVEAITSA
jgi:uncharacterized protein GlcG (DUF336 family)